MATPAPTLVPRPSAIARVTTVAWIEEESLLASTTSLPAVTKLFSMRAFEPERMMFVASAPPPLRPTPVPLVPAANATDAATETALIVLLLVLVSPTSVFDVTSALSSSAVTLSSMRLRAIDTPMARPAALLSPFANERLAPTAVAVTVAVSLAVSAIGPPSDWIGERDLICGGVLTIAARTVVSISFVAAAPAPEAAAAVVPPLAKASDPANATTQIVGCELATTLRLPAATTYESLMKACTPPDAVLSLIVLFATDAPTDKATVDSPPPPRPTPMAIAPAIDLIVDSS